MTCAEQSSKPRPAHSACKVAALASPRDTQKPTVWQHSDAIDCARHLPMLAKPRTPHSSTELRLAAKQEGSDIVHAVLQSPSGYKLDSQVVCTTILYKLVRQIRHVSLQETVTVPYHHIPPAVAWHRGLCSCTDHLRSSSCSAFQSPVHQQVKSRLSVSHPV